MFQQTVWQAALWTQRFSCEASNTNISPARAPPIGTIQKKQSRYGKNAFVSKQDPLNKVFSHEAPLSNKVHVVDPEKKVAKSPGHGQTRNGPGPTVKNG